MFISILNHGPHTIGPTTHSSPFNSHRSAERMGLTEPFGNEIEDSQVRAKSSIENTKTGEESAERGADGTDRRKGKRDCNGRGLNPTLQLEHGTIDRSIATH
jgi:hypothetical protein